MIWFLDLTVAVRLLLLSAINVVQASSQKPLVPEAEDAHTSRNWNFNFSSSAPHLFISVHGLLNQWPNTFFPNGHSIVPCEIAAYTKLYHGRQDADTPPSPEWVSFDIGMAYGIMGGSRNSHMLTYQTTRPAKCIYFDGESATLMGTGQMDTQMLHVYGNTSGVKPPNGGHGLWEEYARALGLCDWIKEKNLGGSGWGVEGIVRMNAGFEMIWCNFTSVSFRLVSHLNITAPLLPESDGGEDERSWYEDLAEAPTPLDYYPLPPSPTNTDRATDPAQPPRPPNWGRSQGREPFFRLQTWSWFAAGTAHYGSSGSGIGLGEVRVKPLVCGYLSYYAPKFLSAAATRANEEQKTLNLTQDGLWLGSGENGTRLDGLTALTRRRRAHTLKGVLTEDAALMKTDSEKVILDLAADNTSCSGMDWTLITNDVVQTYASDLVIFSKMLERFKDIAENKTALREWAVDVRDQTHSFLLPFLQFPSNRAPEHWKRSSAVYEETISHCRYHHTRLLDPHEGVHLGPEESTLKWAVEETMSTICTVLVNIGLSMEGVWDTYFNISPKSTISTSNLSTEVKRWAEGVEELMAWLGWADKWTSCEQKCAWDEKCFIPMWPLVKMNFGHRPPGGGPGHGPPSGEHEPGGEGGPHGRRPAGGPMMDESDLWKPKCVTRDYFLG